MVLRLAVALLVTVLGEPSWAVQDNGCSAASSVSDVHFTLAVKDGRTVFHAGEIVPLELSFTATAKHRYWADVHNYDRSGRLGIESFCVEPEAADPLASYFTAASSLGGGLGGTRELDATPFAAEAELNEWRRLSPGHYRVYAISQRIWRPSDPRERTPYGRVSEVLRSNTVELDVMPPDAEWQAEQLRSATQVLAGNPSPEEAHRAARRLRFLDTPDSAGQLARLFWGLNQQQSVGWDLMFGLYGSPFQKVAIDSMNDELAVPEHPITGEFLGTLVNLQIVADSTWNPPASGPTDSEAARAFWERRRAHTRALADLAVRKVTEALPRKVGVARALTLHGLLVTGDRDQTSAGKIRPALIATWRDLPRETQSELIRHRWPLIAGPEMLPILRLLVAEAPPPARTDRGMTRDAALKHIHELDPEAGRALILRDAVNPSAQPDLEVIRLLPKEDITVVLRSAVERIGQDKARDLDYELLDRFADSSVLGVAQAAFERHLGKWACSPQTAMLRYLLRADPAYGARQVSASLGARKETHCYGSLLQSLGEELPSAQDSAIEALDDSDPEVVQDAVAALGLWGSANAEEALWARLRRFQQEWAGREDELRSTPDYRGSGARAVALEQALVRAIATGRSWICPPEKLARITKLVLTRQQAQQIEAWIEGWHQGSALITSNWAPEGSTGFSVLQYVSLTEQQLRAKLAQFPRGTRLRWQFWQPGQIFPPVSMERQEALYESMRGYAAKNGILLDRANHP
ncbi:hypothetical protein [uncultured Paludibaculum sp.]|uniref:hypothetical protein n=1 Tax=uncultured Paludibaculum sp. TaxID=1765020 RepID=UPI002AAA8D80|nr:hypothetical protein [uncultured Paludibaculum sp.]